MGLPAPKRRLTEAEYQEQIALLRDIASAAQDAGHLCLHLWDMPNCLSTIINAFCTLDRLLFPERIAWDATVGDEADTRRRVHHLTASEFWLKPCATAEIPKEATRMAWAGLHDMLFALMLQYDQVLSDHGWGALIADGRPPISKPPQLSSAVLRLVETSELLVEWSWRGSGGPVCIISLGDQLYQVGDNDPIKVADREDSILQAFLERSPLSKPGLAAMSGYDGETALNVLRTLKGTTRRSAKYGGIFSPCIKMPGRRDGGGYHVRIRSE